jgi:heme/copper-type cytochrome/quinol oxidase subunit 1
MSFIRRFGILILGVGLLVVGTGGFLTWFPRPSFGWSAYAPLTGVTFLPQPNVFDYFLGLAVLGLVLIAGWVGHRIGSRRVS